MDGWVPWVLGGAALVLVLVGLDRAFAAGWFDGPLARARQRRLDRPRTGGAGVDAIGTVVDVFDPAHKHVTDERARERSTTVQVPGDAPPFLDLDAGVATVDGPLPARPSRTSAAEDRVRDRSLEDRSLEDRSPEDRSLEDQLPES